MSKRKLVAVPLPEPVPAPQYRLRAYGNNPNTGATELHTTVIADSMQELVLPLIDLLWSGNPMTDIRLEEL